MYSQDSSHFNWWWQGVLISLEQPILNFWHRISEWIIRFWNFNFKIFFASPVMWRFNKLWKETVVKTYLLIKTSALNWMSWNDYSIIHQLQYPHYHNFRIILIDYGVFCWFYQDIWSLKSATMRKLVFIITW